MSKKFWFLCFVCCLFGCFLHADSSKKTEPGVLIAAMGLSGAGKSSVFRELANEINVTLFSELEEDTCSDAFTKRELSGNFTMLSWLRSMRVPKLYQADLLRKQGQVALVDSYYDKLMSLYIDKPAMHWLISPQDPYYAVTKYMTDLDWQTLPDADVVVFFEVDPETWKTFLKKRNRKLDNDEMFQKSYQTQELLWQATERFAEEKGASIVRFTQEVSSPQQAACTLKKVLIERGILQH